MYPFVYFDLHAILTLVCVGAAVVVDVHPAHPSVDVGVVTVEGVGDRPDPLCNSDMLLRASEVHRRITSKLTPEILTLGCQLASVVGL